METVITNDALQLVIDSNLYAESVVYKCFYWYTKDFEITIERNHDNCWLVQIEKSNHAAFDFATIIPKIKRDLIDFRLREIVSTETRTVRELLIAKAFANYDMDETPMSAISDPVGFDPNNI